MFRPPEITLFQNEETKGETPLTQAALETYSEPCQTSKMEHFAKTAESRCFCKQLQMFDRVLNTPLCSKQNAFP